MHFHIHKFTQVRTKKGGGTRNISVSKDCRKIDLLEKAAELVFPGEKCSAWSFTDSVLSFYLTTKKKIISCVTDSEADSGTVRQGGENMQDSRDPIHSGESSQLTENVEPDIIQVLFI